MKCILFASVVAEHLKEHLVRQFVAVVKRRSKTRWEALQLTESWLTLDNTFVASFARKILSRQVPYWNFTKTTFHLKLFAVRFVNHHLLIQSVFAVKRFTKFESTSRVNIKHYIVWIVGDGTGIRRR